MAERVALDDVRRAARLARLGITDERARAIAQDLNTILEHMDVLARVDTKGAREYTAASVGTPLRADRGGAMPLAARPETFAPVMRDGFFLVPRLGTHEDTEP
jgi:aspartyl-tRNA(Asn)/glutamyl-tRNA(Gln) amidotransferase subunit C